MKTEYSIFTQVDYLAVYIDRVSTNELYLLYDISFIASNQFEKEMNKRSCDIRIPNEY